MNYFKYKSIIYMRLMDNVEIRVYSDETFPRKEEETTEYDGVIKKYYITRADFDEFMRELRDAGLYNWKKEYIDPLVLDGEGWELEYCYNDTIKNIHGQNDYPETFDAFMDALNRLMKKFDEK